MDSYRSVLKLFCCWLWVVTATEAVLQCPVCTYVNTDADVNVAVKTVVDKVLHLFQEPKCKSRISGPTPEIKTETCAPQEGQTAMCSYYDGRVDVEIDIFVTSFTIPMKIYQQGCYYAKSANAPSVGCHDRKNINEDKSAIKRILDSATDLIDDVVSFEGDLCVCRDTYCKDSDDTSRAKRLGMLTPLFILAQFLALILLL